MRTTLIFLRVALAVVTGAWFAPAFATAPADKQPPSAAPPAPPPSAGEPVRVLGFRSAQFGMTEAQVRQAITTDFNVPAKDVTKQQNDSEKTTTLSTDVDNLLPVAGKSRVTYILGYQTQKLVQVNVAWSVGPGRAASSEAIVEAANLLRQHFQKKTYKPDSVLTNAQFPDGSIVVFRGSDMEGRMTLLVLGGEKLPAKGKDPAPSMKPTTLLLSYIKDAEHPDIFQIKPDAF